jgi:hypothetical protein
MPDPQPIEDTKIEPELSYSEKVAQWWETNGLKPDKEKLEQDEASQRRQKNIANTTSAFRTLAEGIYGTKGYRIPKPPENKEYSAADKEINRLRANYDREAQRAKEAKMYAGLRAMKTDEANETRIESNKIIQRRLDAKRLIDEEKELYQRDRDKSDDTFRDTEFKQKKIYDAAKITAGITEKGLTAAAKVSAAKEATKRVELKIKEAEKKGDFTFQNNKETIIIPKKKFNAVYEEIRAALQEEIKNADFKKKLGYPAAIMDKGKLKYTLTPAQQRRVVRDYYNLIHPKTEDEDSAVNALPKQKTVTPKKTKTSTGEGNLFK